MIPENIHERLMREKKISSPNFLKSDVLNKLIEKHGQIRVASATYKKSK